MTSPRVDRDAGEGPDDPGDYVVLVLDRSYGIGDVHGPFTGFGATVAADELQRRLIARGFDELEVRVARLQR